MLLACLMLAVSLPMLASGVQDEGKTMPPGYKPLVIRTDANINTQRSDVPPFDMYYQAGNIVAEFYDNIGLVSVTIVNTNTGNTWNVTLDSSSVISTIDICSENWAGYYELMIVDGHGNCYSGYFELTR